SLTRYRVRGAGATAWLERLSTNRIGKSVGAVTYSLMLDDAGGILSDVTVTRVDEDEYMIGANGPLDLDRFPVVTRELDDGRCLWGHGASRPGEDGGFAVKIGLDDDGTDGLGFSDADPDHLDRSIDLRRDAAALADAVATAYPDVDPTPRSGVACMYTRSADKNFHIGRVPGRDRVLVAAGDSGHGHKHAPAIGELLAQQALGEETFADAGFMRVGR
ncbi:MAG: FAD-dependent oxidoreductase, partial [Actinomycetaceae bacterium]